MSDDHLMHLNSSEFDCQLVEQQLDSYLEGELPAKESTQIDNHLQRCSQCCSLVNDLREIVSVAATLADQPVPVGVSQRLRARLEQDTGMRFDSPKPRLTLISSS